MDVNSIIGISVGLVAVIYMVKSYISTWVISPQRIYNALDVTYNSKVSGYFLFEEHQGMIKHVFYGTDLSLRIVISHKKPLIEKFVITKEDIATKSKKIIGKNDILVGDELFDEMFYIESNDDLSVVPLLDKDVRKTISFLASKSKLFEINEKHILLDLPLLNFKSIGMFFQFLQKIKKLSQDLTGESKLKEKIFSNLAGEESSSVKIKNIDILVKRFGIDGDVREVLEKTIQDKNIDVRILSAQHLGKKGIDFLNEMLDEDMNDDMTLLKIISAVSLNHNSKTITRLKKIYKNSDNLQIKLEILEVFKNSNQKKISTFLIGQLNKEKSILLMKIIEVIGLCGLKEDIEKIYLFGENSKNSSLVKAIDNSIKEIQSRLGLVDNGWLSISGETNTSGSISMAEDLGDGSLSLKKK